MGNDLIVDEIKERISDATAVVVVDRRSFTPAHFFQFIELLKEMGCEYGAYNTGSIVNAIRETIFEPMTPYIEGYCGLFTVYKESESPEKVLQRLYQCSIKFRIRCGMIDGIIYDATTIYDSTKAKIQDDNRKKLQLILLGNLEMPLIRLEYVLKQALKQKCLENGVDYEELIISEKDKQAITCDIENQEINSDMDVQEEHMYERIEGTYADREFITDNEEVKKIYKSEVELITEEAQSRVNEYKRNLVRDIIVIILIVVLAIGFAIYSGMDMLNSLP